MAKSKTRLIAEFMRGVQSDNDNNAVHSEVQAAANAFTFNGVDITQVFFNNASIGLQNLITIATTGMFYGGILYPTYYNRVTRINDSGALIGSETNVGRGGFALAGARL